MSGLIIEGICASGKSMVFNGLSQKQCYIQRQSKIQLSEYLTERIIENPPPTLQQRLDLLWGYVDMLEAINTNFYSSRFNNTSSKSIIPCYLIERFHITHAVESSDFEAFRDIDDRLRELDFRLVILRMDRDVIRDRLEDTFDRRPKTWYNYVMSFGGLDGAAKRYVQMQDRLIDYAFLSSLPKEIIDTTNRDWQQYIDMAEKKWGL